MNLLNWTNHALERALARGIQPEWVDLVLTRGEVREDHKGSLLFCVDFKDPQNEKVNPKVKDLVVVTSRDKSIITVFWLGESDRFQRAWVLSGTHLTIDVEALVPKPSIKFPGIQEWHQALVADVGSRGYKTFDKIKAGVEIEVEGKSWIIGSDVNTQALMDAFPPGSIVTRWRDLCAGR